MHALTPLTDHAAHTSLARPCWLATHARALTWLLVALGALVGCGEEPLEARDTAPSLAQRLGLTQYVGAIDPVEAERDETSITYTFDPQQGPRCMRGDPYQMAVRETDSEDLVFFLQGGGACWSEFCLAVTAAPAGVPNVDILNPSLENNPVADWDVVYLPYCDGSFFSGDAEIDDNLNNKGVRTHKGLANLTAALEVSKRHFPDPPRIFLAGSSGGAYGLLLGSALVRHYYPDAELIIMADSGVGLARTNDQPFLDTILDEFNLRRFIPQDCPDCVQEAHLTGVLSYFLDHDDNSRIAVYSAWYDTIIGDTFLKMSGQEHADALQRQTDRVVAAHPERFRRFITDGVQHTALLGDPTGIIGTDIGAVELPPDALSTLVGGNLVIRGINNTAIGELTMAQWLDAFIQNDLDAWRDVLEERGPAPD